MQWGPGPPSSLCVTSHSAVRPLLVTGGGGGGGLFCAEAKHKPSMSHVLTAPHDNPCSVGMRNLAGGPGQYGWMMFSARGTRRTSPSASTGRTGNITVCTMKTRESGVHQVS